MCVPNLRAPQFRTLLTALYNNMFVCMTAVLLLEFVVHVLVVTVVALIIGMAKIIIITIVLFRNQLNYACIVF